MIIDKSTPLITYDEWLADDTIDKTWMTAAGFFLGQPLATEDAPVNTTIRAAVYAYLADKFGDRLLGMRDTTMWGRKFKARLTQTNGAFWKQWQMDNLVNIKSLVTADYTETSYGFGSGSNVVKSESTGVQASKGTGKDTASITAQPVTTTTTDASKLGAQTTATTPTTAARVVSLTSELAESTYAGGDIPGDGYTDTTGMPSIDTSHGSAVAANWNISEGVTQTISREANSGSVTNVAGLQQSDTEGDNSTTATSTGANGGLTQSINDNTNGSYREGTRDFNGYNLSASIAAVQALLPYDYLNKQLGPLFMASIGIDEEDDVWQ